MFSFVDAVILKKLSYILLHLFSAAVRLSLTDAPPWIGRGLLDLLDPGATSRGIHAFHASTCRPHQPHRCPDRIPAVRLTGCPAARRAAHGFRAGSWWPL